MQSDKIRRKSKGPGQKEANISGIVGSYNVDKKD